MIDDDLPMIRKVREDLARSDRTLGFAAAPRRLASGEPARRVAEAQMHIRAARQLLDAAIAGAGPVVDNAPLRVVR